MGAAKTGGGEVMTVSDVLEQFNRLQEQGHSDAEVFLDTGPDGLHSIEEIDLDPESDDVIIWGQKSDRD
jgi:hypothetical protein